MNCKSTVFVLLCLLCVSTANKRVYDSLLDNELPYPLPELGMSYHALEPHIDSATLRVHHTGHHQAYTNVMNKALKEWRADVSE